MRFFFVFDCYLWHWFFLRTVRRFWLRHTPRGAGMYQTFWRTRSPASDTPFTWRQYSLWKFLEKPCHLLQWVLKFPRCSWSSSFSLRQASNRALNTAFAFAVPPCLNTIAWKTYFIFGSFNFAAFLQVCFMYPETVGRSLEGVEEIFSQGHMFTAWKIGTNVGEKTLKELVEKSKNLPVTFSFFF